MAIANASKFLATVLRSGTDEVITKVVYTDGSELTEENAYGWNESKQAFEGIYVNGAREIYDFSIERDGEKWEVEIVPSKKVKNNNVKDD